MLMIFSVTGRLSSDTDTGTKYKISTSFAEKFESECSVLLEITALVERHFCQFHNESGRLSLQKQKIHSRCQ